MLPASGHGCGHRVLLPAMPSYYLPAYPAAMPCYPLPAASGHGVAVIRRPPSGVVIPASRIRWRPRSATTCQRPAVGCGHGVVMVSHAMPSYRVRQSSVRLPACVVIPASVSTASGCDGMRCYGVGDATAGSVRHGVAVSVGIRGGGVGFVECSTGKSGEFLEGSPPFATARYCLVNVPRWKRLQYAATVSPLAGIGVAPYLPAYLVG